MLLLLKCSDIKKVKSFKDQIIIDLVLGGKPTKKRKTGILMWDLSAAFDCLDLKNGTTYTTVSLSHLSFLIHKSTLLRRKYTLLLLYYYYLLYLRKYRQRVEREKQILVGEQVKIYQKITKFKSYCIYNSPSFLI